MLNVPITSRKRFNIVPSFPNGSTQLTGILTENSNLTHFQTKELCRHCGSEVVEFKNHRFKDESLFKLCSSPICVADAFDDSWAGNLPYGNDQPILVPLPIKPSVPSQNNDYQDILDEMNGCVTVPHQTENTSDLLPVESNFVPIKTTENCKLSEDSSGIDVQSCSSSNSDNKMKMSSQNVFLKLKNELPDKSQLEKRFKDVQKWPHWKNEHNLCWLDVLLTIFVHNSVLRRLLRMEENHRTTLHQLIATYDDMILLLNPHLRRVSPESDIEGRYELDSSSVEDVVEQHMNNIRFTVLDSLIPDLRNYKIGNAESPVNALKLLMKNSANIRQFLQVEFTNTTVCQTCGASDTTNLVRDFVTIPSPTKNLSFRAPTYLRKCPNIKCKNLEAHSTIKWKNLPPCFAFLFPNGYNPEKSRIGNILQYLNFEFEQKMYKLRAVIQLVEKKFKGAVNHFITWIRDYECGHWMRCDDLSNAELRFQKNTPLIYSTEISMLFFEISDEDPVNLKPRVTTPVRTKQAHAAIPNPIQHNSNGKSKFDFSSLSSFPSYQRKISHSSLSSPVSEPSGRRRKRTRDSLSVTNGVTVNLIPICKKPKKSVKETLIPVSENTTSKVEQVPSEIKEDASVNAVDESECKKTEDNGMSEHDITRIIDPLLPNNLSTDYDLMRALNDDILSGFLTET
ncbi:DgyrCDS3312 [Dimorphilus gyrociliatus]|uniref:DgyrCDS3312 n=1 Tax=Dimorphilus gyrociliatus TaxID=2664684 RepID=A0A7I8VDY6_9ANNE|nr:DgyrCDS3312 [Dimorphilus gyrociliatus]